MLPEWASGFWQCKLRYRTQDELLSVAREYKRRGLPLSVIVMRLLPLDPAGRLEVRPGRVARPGRHGARAGAARHQADGLGLAHGQPGSARTTPRWSELGYLVANEHGLGLQLASWDRGSAVRGPDGLLRRDQPARPATTSGPRSGTTTSTFGIKTCWLDACEPELDARAAGEPALPRRSRPRGRQRLPAASTPAASTRACRPRASRRSCCCAGPPGRAASATARRVVRRHRLRPSRTCAGRSRPG